MSNRSEIVAHITSGDSADWKMAIRNLSNLYRNESVPTPASELKVVVNGEAVRFLLSTAPESDQIGRMADAGIQINACRNSFDRFDYPVDDLTSGVTTVPSGVAEVVRLQRHGVTYLKLP